MKILQLLFLLLVPVVVIAQRQLTEADIQEIITLSETGQTNLATQKIEAFRKTVTEKDSLYTTLIVTSAEMNMSAEPPNWEAAIKDNEEIIQLEPAMEFDCQIQIAACKKSLGDFDGAIAALQRALQLQPSDPVGLNNLASAFNAAGQYQNVINLLNSNPSTERLSIDYHYAVAYFNLNNLDSAKTHIDEYLQTDNASKDFNAYKIAAQIYAALNDKAKSCAFITKSNEIIETTNLQEQINKQPDKVKSRYVVKQLLEEIDKVKTLKGQYCR